MAETPRHPGGFLPPTSSQYARALPSPAPSTASSRAAARLPAPRSKPLAPGSRKEDYARDYVSKRLLHIARRYVKKHGGEEEEGEGDNEGGKEKENGGKSKEEKVTGYENAEQLCADLEEVVDVLWFSGTPSLQIPYLINVAHALTTYLASFPPAPRPTFTLLHKLDHCFASLLVGRDVKSRAPLAGFAISSSSASSPSSAAAASAAAAQVYGLSRTDMVRIKSIADETRRLVAVVMSGEADVENRDDYDEREDDEDDDDAYDYRDEKPKAATRIAAAGGAGAGDSSDVSRLVKKEYRMLDPFEEQIDPGEGIVYKLKPEGANYGGFVADEETDEEEQGEDNSAPAKVKRENEGEGDDDAADEDGDDDEFVDVAQPTIIPKRKVDDDGDLSDGTAEVGDPKKRTKIKEEDRQNGAARDKDTAIPDRGPPPPSEPSGGASDGDSDSDDDDKNDENLNTSRAPPRPPAHPSESIATPSQPGPAGTAGGASGSGSGSGSGARQFHFTLDDSDSEDDDEGGETLANADAHIANGSAHPQQRFADGDRAEAEGGEGEEEEEEDDEEEEMHMNVARVYEKTLVRLGKIMLEEEQKDARAEGRWGYDHDV